MKKHLLTLVLTILLNVKVGVLNAYQDIEYVSQFINYQTIYKQMIESVKKYEGLSLKKYLCPAGFPTIGYGHLIKSYESIPDTISKMFADSLLMSDIEDNIKNVEYLTGIDRYDQPNKVLALTHLVYNIGASNFASSNLLNKIKMNRPIESEMMKWVHINHEPSIGLINRRLYEIKFYKET